MTWEWASDRESSIVCRRRHSTDMLMCIRKKWLLLCFIFDCSCATVHASMVSTTQLRFTFSSQNNRNYRQPHKLISHSLWVTVSLLTISNRTLKVPNSKREYRKQWSLIFHPNSLKTIRCKKKMMEKCSIEQYDLYALNGK